MLITEITSLLTTHAKELISVSVPFAIWLLNRQFQPSTKLVHSIRHTFRFLIPEPIRDAEGKVIRPVQNVNVASVSVTNVGRRAGKLVEITLNWKPMYLNVWPSRHYEVKDAPDGRHTIFLDSLAPKEVLGMEMLAVNAELPAICNVRSEEVESIEKAMIPQVVQSPPVLIFAAWLMLIGAIATVYIILVLIEVAMD
jgi:hypothetical protein